MQIVIAGGGFAGCAAALQAARMGAKVILAERTDMLCGTGAVGGIMYNNGRYTAAGEMTAMGGGQLFFIIDQNIRHRNVEFFGQAHASLFDVAKTGAEIERTLRRAGVDIRLKTRIISVHHLWKNEGKQRLMAVKDQYGAVIEGDAFIDATGTGGPPSKCRGYGRGCVCCILRCPVFGGRVSLCDLCGIEEFSAKSQGKEGAISGSCSLMKDSLAPQIVKSLDEKGVAIIDIPKDLIEDHLALKACRQYALPEYATHIVLLDTGHAKMMAPWFPLEKLRKIPGLEWARYEDPYAGGEGNSVRLTASVLREDTLLVRGMENLFCNTRSSVNFVGHTEAIVTGVLAGYNAVRKAMGKSLWAYPQQTACGDAIRWIGQQMETEAGRREKYTFSGSVLFDRMKEKGLYTTDMGQIRQRVGMAGGENIFALMP